MAVGLSTRPTEDLDLFTAAVSIEPAADALEVGIHERGWHLERIHDALRDFIDVAAVAEQIDMDELLGLAARIDAGFDKAVLAEMIATLHRFTDDEIRAYGADPTVLRAFFADQ